MKLAVVCCLHGNERYGLDVIKELPEKISIFVGNELAIEKNVRFIDSDLNRSFPGKREGNHEERLAFSLVSSLKNFDYVIDLHSSSNNCPLFGIVTNPSEEKFEFARKLGLDKVVIMPESFGKGKSLLDHVKCGVALEIGPHNGKGIAQEVLEKINNFIFNKEFVERIDVFEVFDIVRQDHGEIVIKNFNYVRKGQVISCDSAGKQIADFDFIAVLVGEKAYGRVLCLACRKIR
jgi:succinylglutamate desuccinylase